MNDYLAVAVLIITATIVSFVVGLTVGDYNAHSNAGYFECISDLPRNQNCKLVAVAAEAEE